MMGVIGPAPVVAMRSERKDAVPLGNVTSRPCHIPATCSVVPGRRTRGSDAMDARNDTALEQAWRDNRRHLLDIAFRMLGNVSEAEDVVQEGFARLLRVDLDEIDDVRGWMVVVVSRLCLDRLRASRRHPTSSADSLDEHP